MIKGINLTLLIGPGVPLPAPRDVLDALQSVKVEDESGDTQSGFELSFDDREELAADHSLHARRRRGDPVLPGAADRHHQRPRRRR